MRPKSDLYRLLCPGNISVVADTNPFGADMRRTTEPGKTSVTSVAFALALAAFVLWMTSFATRSEGLFNQGGRATLAAGAVAEAAGARASAS